MTIEKITEAAQRIKELEMQKKLLEDEIEGLKNPVKDQMEERGEEELIAGIYTIRYSDVTSNRFNQSAFKKSNATLYADVAQSGRAAKRLNRRSQVRVLSSALLLQVVSRTYLN